MADIESDELGSLAQSGRKQHLKSARTTMFVIGAITIVANVVLALLAEKAPGVAPEDIRAVQISGFAFAGLGLVFVVLGLLIYSAPVACTVLALILYIGGWAISGLGNPAMLANGLIIKIIIVVYLVKAIQAAVAYQREEAAA